MVAGRTNEVRVIAGVGTTAASTALTAPSQSFNEEDAGRPISGTGIPANATLATVNASGAAATLSANASATGTVSATVGANDAAAAQLYGLAGWSPETDAESETYSVAANNAGTITPDRIVNPFTPAGQRSRG